MFNLNPYCRSFFCKKVKNCMIGWCLMPDLSVFHLYHDRNEFEQCIKFISYNTSPFEMEHFLCTSTTKRKMKKKR